jgi:hypothetical protein
MTESDRKAIFETLEDMADGRTISASLRLDDGRVIIVVERKVYERNIRQVAEFRHGRR